jgi:hypothetical protein
VVQYWLHVSHDAWFAPLLPTFRGRGPLKRLQNTAALYDFTETAGTSGGESCPFDKDTWRNKVHAAVDDAAVRYLQERAAQRGLSGPEVASRRNGLLKLAGGPPLCTRGRLPCEVRGSVPAVLSDHSVRRLGRAAPPPVPALQQPRPLRRPLPRARVCGSPPSPRVSQKCCAVLGRTPALEVREGPAKLLSNVLLGKTSQVPALRLLGSLGSARPWVAGFTRWAKLEVTFCGALTLTKKAVKQAKADAV